MLGCLNNRQQQLKKVAKAVGLKFTHPDKKKEETPTQQQQTQQRKAWGANNTSASSKTGEGGTAKRITNSVEPNRLGKGPQIQTQTHVKFPDINGRPEPPVRKIMSNLGDNARYKITR